MKKTLENKALFYFGVLLGKLLLLPLLLARYVPAFFFRFLKKEKN